MSPMLRAYSRPSRTWARSVSVIGWATKQWHAAAGSAAGAGSVVAGAGPADRAGPAGENSVQ
jgi:hypothetical protein